MSLTDPLLDRRTVLGAACVGCVALVAACGGSDDDTAPAAAGTSSSAAAPTSAAPGASSAAPAADAIAQLSDIPVGSAVAAKSGDTAVIVVRTGESSATAVNAKCPHQGCSVAPQGGALVCPCHGSKFQLDGTLVNGPATKDLADFPVSVVDGAVVAA